MKKSLLSIALVLCLALSAPGGAALAETGYAPGQVLLEENFDGIKTLKAGGYAVRFQQSQRASTQRTEIKNGALNVVNTAKGSNGSTFIHMFTCPDDLTEFTFSCDFTVNKMGSANKNGYPGLMLYDSGDTPNERLVAIFARTEGADENNNPGINRYIEGAYVKQGSAQATGFSFELKHSYRLRAEMTQDNIYLSYRDNETPDADYIPLVSAKNYREGKAFGLLARGADVTFDNVLIAAGISEETAAGGKTALKNRGIADVPAGGYAPGQTLFAENFDDLASFKAGGYAARFQSGKGSATKKTAVENGALRVVNTAGGSDGSTFIPLYEKPDDLDDLTFLCDIVVNAMGSANKNGYPGLMLNDAGGEPNERLTAVFARAVGADEHYGPGINRYADGAYTPTGSAQAGEFLFEMNRAYRLKVTLSKEKITLYAMDLETEGADYEKLCAAENGREGNLFGLLARGADVTFDNILITAGIEKENAIGMNAAFVNHGVIGAQKGPYIQDQLLFEETFDALASLEEGGYQTRVKTGQERHTALAEISDGALRIVNTAEGSGGTTFINLFSRPEDLIDFTLTCDIVINAMGEANANGYPGLMLNDSGVSANQDLIAAFARAQGADAGNNPGLNRYADGAYTEEGSAQAAFFRFEIGRSYTLKAEITEYMIVFKYRDNTVPDGAFKGVCSVLNNGGGDVFGLLARGVDATFDNVRVQAGINCGDPVRVYDAAAPRGLITSRQTTYAPGEVIFEETFDGLTSLEEGGYLTRVRKGQEIFTSKVAVENGALRIVNTASCSNGSVFVNLFTRPEGLDEMTFTCDIVINRLSAFDHNGYPGLMLNDSGATPNQSLVGCFARVIGADLGFFPGINRYVNGGYTQEGSGQTEESPFLLGRRYQLRAEMNKEEIYLLYRDLEEEDADFTLLAFAPNYMDGNVFGLLARGVDATFDNARVTAGITYQDDYGSYWIDPEEVAATEYAYTLAVIPDTQKLTEVYQSKLAPVIDYLRDNAETQNIRFAMHMGDLTDTNAAYGWVNIASAMSALDGAVPYAIVPGNHDYNTGAARDLTRMNNAFPYESRAAAGSPAFGGAFDKTGASNTYHVFEAGGVHYLVLALEIAPRDAVLAWAKRVVESHPTHNVIITTHAYLNQYGDRISGSELQKAYPYLTDDLNGADAIWSEIGGVYENVKMILCGHWLYDDVVYRAEKGVHGNTVHQFMINGQTLDSARGGVGMLMLMRVSADGSHIDAQYYSVLRDQYYRDINQISFDIDLIR